MKGEVGDSLTIVAYHVSDEEWTNPDGTGRKNFYSIPGTPTLYCDGPELPWNGGANYNYDGFREEFDKLKVIPPEVEITLSGEYDQISGVGEATASITNITLGEIEGVCHFVICQRDTPFVWQSETELHHIERKMLTDFNGSSVTIAQGETEEVTQSFTIEEAWERDGCYLTVFVQKSSKEVIQAFEINLDELTQTGVNPGITVGSSNNPNDAIFTIGTSQVNSYLKITFFRKAAKLDIIDCKGSIKKTVGAQGMQVIIPVGDLSAGIYFCISKEKDRIQKRKFIKF